MGSNSTSGGIRRPVVVILLIPPRLSKVTHDTVNWIFTCSTRTVGKVLSEELVSTDILPVSILVRVRPVAVTSGEPVVHVCGNSGVPSHLVHVLRWWLGVGPPLVVLVKDSLLPLVLRASSSRRSSCWWSWWSWWCWCRWGRCRWSWCRWGRCTGLTDVRVLRQQRCVRLDETTRSPLKWLGTDPVSLSSLSVLASDLPPLSVPSVRTWGWAFHSSASDSVDIRGTHLSVVGSNSTSGGIRRPVVVILLIPPRLSEVTHDTVNWVFTCSTRTVGKVLSEELVSTDILPVSILVRVRPVAVTSGEPVVHVCGNSGVPSHFVHILRWWLGVGPPLVVLVKDGLLPLVLRASSSRRSSCWWSWWCWCRWTWCRWSWCRWGRCTGLTDVRVLRQQ